GDILPAASSRRHVGCPLSMGNLTSRFSKKLIIGFAAALLAIVVIGVLVVLMTGGTSRQAKS
ncbi:MAG: hypothetical protein WCO36_10130, partial [Actinomycetes bacterium]